MINYKDIGRAITFMVIICINGSLFGQKFENLAPTPIMGWNSWNTFEVKIDEKLVRETADLLVSSGMATAGYKYLVLDDGWMAKKRDSITGDLVPDPAKFPGGMKSLIDYVHSKGLKFGLYNCAGRTTCAGFPGTRGYEYQDARFYAKLKIDFLKYDWCDTKGIQAPEAYETMSKALKAAGRPIVFSICEWGDNKPWEWAAPYGQLWRVSGDINPCFDCENNHGTWSSWGVLKILNMRKDIRKYAGPNHWNDLDMLEVGNGMSYDEDMAHFALWAMMASPLVAGNDLRTMTKETRSILTHKGLIDINQDPLGISAFKYMEMKNIDVYFKPLVNDEWAVCILNRSETEQNFSLTWKNYQINDPDFKYTLDLKTKNYSIEDVIESKSIGETKDVYSAKLKPHSTIVLKLKEL